jgi:prepilin-type N-terminal cleavage/methylation domain-containing protein
MNNKGFTLIELILVIAILGILAVSAMPKIFSLTTEANIAAAAGVIANVGAGITLYGAKQMASTGIESYPAKLDTEPPGFCGKCFGNVVKDTIGGSTTWQKISDSKYKHTPTSITYTYDSNAGTFK